MNQEVYKQGPPCSGCSEYPGASCNKDLGLCVLGGASSNDEASNNATVSFADIDSKFTVGNDNDNNNGTMWSIGEPFSVDASNETAASNGVIDGEVANNGPASNHLIF